MGYSGKLEEKNKAQKLRKQGLSYKEIQQKVKVSKDTLSRWCRDIPLTKEQENRLIGKRNNGQRRGSIIAAERKRKKRAEETQKIFLEAKKDLGKLDKRDRFIAGIALYAGEGYKSDNGNVGFTNGDPDLIKFMKQWLDEFCDVPQQKFRGAIWIHDNLDAEKAKDFWSKTANIPKTQFHKTYISKNKTNSNKVRKNRYEHGIFSIVISSVVVKRKILGWTQALFGGKI